MTSPTPPATGPALTPEEWAGDEQTLLGHKSGKLGWFMSVERIDGTLMVRVVAGPDPFLVEPADLHVLAALALYGQPFGFTGEDVETLRAEVLWLEGRSPHVGDRFTRAAAYRSLADRLSALLPPTSTEEGK